MVARHGGQAKRGLARTDEPRQQGAPGQLADDVLTSRVRAGHPSPRSARILAAYWPGPPRKAAVPATRAVAPAAIACGALLGSMPPSTSMVTSRPSLLTRLATASIFFSWLEMNFCPP